MNKTEGIRRFGNLYYLFYRFVHPSKIRVRKGNHISIKGVFLNHCKISVTGTNNSLVIEPGVTRLKDCTITLTGSNCSIYIGKDNDINQSQFYVCGKNSSVKIGEGNIFRTNAFFEASEGKSVEIGGDSMFTDIHFRVSDWHSIIDSETGKRINPPKSVKIGNHVWIAGNVTILKGAVISDNTIVGANTLVSGKVYPPNCILAGVPAKVVREGVTWNTDLLPFDDNE